MYIYCSIYIYLLPQLINNSQLREQRGSLSKKKSLMLFRNISRLLSCPGIFPSHYPKLMINLLSKAYVLGSCSSLLSRRQSVCVCIYTYVHLLQCVAFSCHQLLYMLLTTMGAKVNWSKAVAAECQMQRNGRNKTSTPRSLPTS